MGPLLEPQIWLSFFTLTSLEIVLGIDNIIFLSILVGRLAPAKRRTARFAGLVFAMLTRLSLLYSIVWLITLRRTVLTVLDLAMSWRDLVLFSGGLFLIVNSVVEIGEMLRGAARERRARVSGSVVLTVVQIGLVDIVFSLDSVFTAVGLARRVEVMAAAIIVSVLFMMSVAGAVSAFIERQPSIKVLALAFLVVVGGALLGESVHRPVPSGYLYFALAFSLAVEWINLRARS